MVNDPEQQLYEDMANLTEIVPKLQNETKTLKTRLTKLSSRVDSLELMTFQDQISKLDDKVNSMNKNMIALSRVVVFNEMDALFLHMQDAIRNKLLANDPNKIRLREYLSVERAKATEKSRNSPTPLDVLKVFKKECISCSNKYDLGAFASKP